MKGDVRNALSLVLERGVLGENVPEKVLFFNAQLLPGLGDTWKTAFICEQSHRHLFLELEQSGYDVLPDVSARQEIATAAIVLLGRNRLMNEFKIAEAWKRLPTGRRLIVAGNKKDGIGSIRKWFGHHAETKESYSKHHAVVFWADKQDDAVLPFPDLETSIDGYVLAEGMFSSSGPDKGSMLLAEHFDNRISGIVADLGAGWGYLSAELLKRSDAVRQIDLFETDHHSLIAAKENLARHDDKITTHWNDITTEFPKKPYDWIIMNPPFHTGRAAQPGLGTRFIEVAASTLPRGGRLLMVSNKNLPYEKTLETTFRQFKKIDERDGFKVIEAQK